MEHGHPLRIEKWVAVKVGFEYGKSPRMGMTLDLRFETWSVKPFCQTGTAGVWWGMGHGTCYGGAGYY